MQRLIGKLRKSKYKYVFFWLLPVPVVCICFLFLYQPSYYLLLSPKKGLRGIFEINAYNDKMDQGNSECTLLKSDTSGIAFRYTLGANLAFPYSGITLSAGKNKFLDLSAYDVLRVKLKATKGKRIFLVFNTHIDNYSRPGEYYTYKNLEYTANIYQESKTLNIPFRKFETPTWWYTRNDIREDGDQPANWSKVKSFNITNCIALNRNTEDTILLEELSLHKDLTFFYFRSALISLVYYLLGGFLLLRKKEQPKAEVTFNYEKVATVNHQNKEEEAIFGFLTSNYFRQELTIVEVQNAIGISESKISATIKKKTTLNFRQFLNKLRISEAKRLLLETDLQVSEIAFKVGYGNISNFNRVFKESENCSPNDFRKKEAEKL